MLIPWLAKQLNRVKCLSKILGRRLNAMENDKNMNIEFPNAMPNTKMLTEALDTINELANQNNI